LPSSRKIVLASSSPFRREILERLQLTFESISPDIDETALPGESALALVARLAAEKAHAVATDMRAGLVIGCDQVCLLDGQILSKPTDHNDAVRQLMNASGKQAQLHNGLAVTDAASGETRSEIVSVNVVYRTLEQDEIERYLLADQPYNCCGSLEVESLGISLLDSIDSNDPNAITGMPVIALLRMLRQFGAYTL